MKLQDELLARFPLLAKAGQWPRALQICLAAAGIAVIIALALWAQAPQYKVLFSNLEDRDGGAVVTALGQMNVPYKFSADGTALLVPADRVYQTRLQLASQGLPRGGKVGFELLDHTPFGASQFTEQIAYQRALEGELVNSIEAINAVHSARVHLAIPRETLFVRDRQSPTASVLLTLYPGRTLSAAQVSAVTWLVSASVPNLTADKVSVVDQNGRLLTAPAGESGSEGARRTYASDVEQRAVQRILAILTPLVGADNVRAQASADIDFAQRERTSETYRPNQQPGQAAVRSEQTSDSSSNGVPPPQGVPGALTNQPPANATAAIVQPPPPRNNARNAANGADAPAPAASETTSTGGSKKSAPSGQSRHDATINYELDRHIEHVKDPLGQVRRLSVAVVVNYRRNGAGKLVPLEPADMTKLENLVKEAMGYSAARNDSVSVVNSPFSADEIHREPPVWTNPVYQDAAMQLLRYLLIAVLILLLWRKLLRPLLSALLARPVHVAVTNTASDTAAAAARRASEISRYEDNLGTARRMAEKDPRAVAMVLRSWMGNNGSN